jgi:FMN-dependent oxidoreductase (nitrilotriacetate monooxygenase family)
MPKHILLNHFDMNSPGHQSCGLWRHPRDRSGEYYRLEYWTNLARTLERGRFDGIFLADVSGVYDVYGGSPDAALRTAMQVPANDPFTLVPAMAAVTEHLSFGVTGAIPYEHPYTFARRVSSLDHLTRGRFAWNVVTGYLDSAARAHGHRQQTTHDARYDIADEYMALVYQLWEASWADDAAVRDRAAGVFTRPERVRRIEHHGEHFELSAIHLCEPSPQRTPVIFQAGASPRGQAFAARHAECVFMGGATPEGLGRAIEGLRAQLEAAGRKRDELKVFGLLCLVVDETDARAQEKLEGYRQYVQPEGALALMSGWSGVDLSAYGLDERVADIRTEAIQSVMRGSHTVREYGESLAIGGAAPVLCGSPQTVADQLQIWHEVSGADGFNLAYTVMPESVEAIVDLLIPELQARGVFKKAYAPGTLREKLFGRGPRLSVPHPAAETRAWQ